MYTLNPNVSNQPSSTSAPIVPPPSSQGVGWENAAAASGWPYDGRQLITVLETCRILSISRSLVYELMQQGTIASISLKKKGAKRGARRVILESVLAFCKQSSAQIPQNK